MEETQTKIAENRTKKEWETPRLWTEEEFCKELEASGGEGPDAIIQES